MFHETVERPDPLQHAPLTKAAGCSRTMMTDMLSREPSLP